jgi:phospholipid/cholesterol/gamma-HCH transport system substrate-binding protein
VNDLRAGKGTLGKLLTDDSAYSAFTGFAEEGRTLAARLNRGEGTLGKLVVDDSLWVTARTIADDIRTVTTDVKDGKGSLGKLLRDDELYNRLAQAIKAVGGAIEDAREAAPVTTFTSALFAIF